MFLDEATIAVHGGNGGRGVCCGVRRDRGGVVRVGVVIDRRCVPRPGDVTGTRDLGQVQGHVGLVADGVIGHIESSAEVEGGAGC